jgi:hypothetical protein
MSKSPPRFRFPGRGGFDSARTSTLQNVATFSKARLKEGEHMSMENVQPENSAPVQLRTSTPLSTLMFRFFGLLFLAVTVLALVWSR